jgi:hypothetical protein
VDDERCTLSSSSNMVKYKQSFNMDEQLAMASSEIIFEVLESPEGGYEARALGYSIFTQAETAEELKTMVRDAVRCHFDDESTRPQVIRLHMVRDELISA